MAKTAVNQFDKFSGNNTDVDNVNVGSGMTIDNTNDAFQHLMALIAQQQGTIGAQSVDLASASLTDLVGANGWSVNVTGTNTITDFGGTSLFTGAMFWLYIVNGLSVTYNAAKILTPNNANLPLNVGDVIQVKHEGAGKWRVLNYFPASGSALPSGTVIDYAGTTAPPGWLLCEGQAVSRTGYPTLFAIIGTTFGAGNTTTTFNLPDLRGRVTVGHNGQVAGRLTSAGWNAPGSGAVGGSENVTLTAPQAPSHVHAFSVSGSTGSVSTDHTHFVSINTGLESAGHQHGVNDGGGAHVSLSGGGAYGAGASTQVLSSGVTANHYHLVSGSSGTMSAYHTHAFSYSGATDTRGADQPHSNLQPMTTMTKMIKT